LGGGAFGAGGPKFIRDCQEFFNRLLLPLTYKKKTYTHAHSRIHTHSNLYPPSGGSGRNRDVVEAGERQEGGGEAVMEDGSSQTAGEVRVLLMCAALGYALHQQGESQY